jgi:hypothetical protein
MNEAYQREVPDYESYQQRTILEEPDATLIRAN